MALVDHYGGTFILFILTTLEVCLVVWWYGVDNFCLDIEFMLKKKVGWYWRLCWGIVTPCIMVVILVYFMITQGRFKYEGVEFPFGIEAVGWIILVAAIAQIFIWWARYVYKSDLEFKLALENSVSHTMWRPKNIVDYQEWKMFKDTVLEERRFKNRTWGTILKELFLGR